MNPRSTKPKRVRSGKAVSGKPSAGRRSAPTVLVHLEVRVDGAREVHLAGNFNDWQETTLPMVDLGHGRWTKELVLPPGDYEYLFIADGRWIPDPAAPASVPNPFGGVNSILHVE